MYSYIPLLFIVDFINIWAIVVKILYGQEVAMRGPTRRAIVIRRARKMRSIAPYGDAETTPGAVQSGVPA